MHGCAQRAFVVSESEEEKDGEGRLDGQPSKYSRIPPEKSFDAAL